MASRMFIQIKDGSPVNHPIVESNFRDAFPKIDMNNLPKHFAEFIRVPMPEPDEGKIIVSARCTYEWDGNVVKDVWHIVQEDEPVYVPEDTTDNG
jgi:hypothetical protein